MAQQGAPEMLTTSKLPPDHVRVITQLQTEFYQVREQMQGLVNAMVQQNANRTQGNREPKELTRWRSIHSVPNFNGEERQLKDFEFKLQQFIRPVNGFEKIINWVRDQDVEPNNESMTRCKQETGVEL